MDFQELLFGLNWIWKQQQSQGWQTLASSWPLQQSTSWQNRHGFNWNMATNCCYHRQWMNELKALASPEWISHKFRIVGKPIDLFFKNPPRVLIKLWRVLKGSRTILTESQLETCSFDFLESEPTSSTWTVNTMKYVRLLKEDSRSNLQNRRAPKSIGSR